MREFLSLCFSKTIVTRMGITALVARIVSIADASAMTSTRPYRKGMSVEEALRRIEEGAGTQFDMELASHMCELGRAGDLVHIVGHTADGIPTVTCPHCGPVIAIPRNTKTEILFIAAPAMPNWS